MLGGPSKGNPIPTLIEFEKGLKAGKNVRGILAGRNIHFPGPDDPAGVAQAAHQIVHKGQSVKEVISVIKSGEEKTWGCWTISFEFFDPSSCRLIR